MSLVLTDMGPRHATALKILLFALGLGAFGDALFYQTNLGVNIALWILLLFGAGLVVVARAKVHANRGSVWPALSALLFALGFAIHDSPGIRLVNVLGLVFSLGLLASSVRGRPLLAMSNIEAALSPAVSWVMSVGDVFLLFVEDVEWKVLGSRQAVRRAAPVVRGLLIAAPVLMVFAGLMASADAVFRQALSQPWKLDFVEIYSHGALFVLFSGLAIGLLRRGLIAEPVSFDTGVAKPAGPSGAIEATVVLGALVGLFATFVSIQFRYLFGNRQWIVESTGLSYADYARQGFFELVAITALALPVLLVTTSVARRGSSSLVRGFTGLAVAMVLLLGMVMVSAVQRMGLYISTSGLSELRFYTTAFMIWIAGVALVYCRTALVGKPHRFGSLALGFGLLVGLLLNVSCPGRWIAEHNLSVARATHGLDASYLQMLGADAVPVLMRSLPGLPTGQRQATAEYLQSWASGTGDWRGFNLSRFQAERIVSSKRTELAMASSPR